MVEPIGPPLQCFSHRLRVRRPVVNTSNTRTVAGDMIENGLDDVRLDTKLGHLRCSGPTQIMQAPTGYAYVLAQPLRGAVPIVEAAEDKIRGVAARLLGKDSEGLCRERQAMLAVILSAVGWEYDLLPPRSTSAQVSLPISFRRWPVSNNNRTISEKGSVPRPRQRRRNSSGVNTHSLLPPSSALAVPATGLVSNRPSLTHQAKKLLSAERARLRLAEPDEVSISPRSAATLRRSISPRRRRWNGAE